MVGLFVEMNILGKVEELVEVFYYVEIGGQFGTSR